MWFWRLPVSRTSPPTRVTPFQQRCNNFACRFHTVCHRCGGSMFSQKQNLHPPEVKQQKAPVKKCCLESCWDSVLFFVRKHWWGFLLRWFRLEFRGGWDEATDFWMTSVQMFSDGWLKENNQLWPMLGHYHRFQWLSQATTKRISMNMNQNYLGCNCYNLFLICLNPELGIGENPRGCNLFVFHLPDDWTDEDLLEYFTPHGTVVSAKAGGAIYFWILMKVLV